MNKPAQRKKVLQFFFTLVVLAGVGYAGYDFIKGDKIVSTDNAYTAVEMAQITPFTSGTVEKILVKDTQEVKQGDVLVQLDPTDARIKLQETQAQVESQQVELRKAEIDLKRRDALLASGSVSGDELTHASYAFDLAKANLQAAQARRDQAKVDLDRTTITSPVNGVVAKRQVQLGQKVSAGMVLMSVVPVSEMHVDANYRENQLDKVRVGQPVTLVTDLYGDAVVFHGVVEGFSGGTGSAFATIPAQNATGNWIKVVQRLPVRIKLDPQELAAHPLKVGLSMRADIDTH